jgi:hypothetical protein
LGVSAPSAQRQPDYVGSLKVGSLKVGSLKVGSFKVGSLKRS